jgi:glutamyl-tRNA synthetase
MRRGRFAPTPSGLLHIGNARTALLAWLQMRKAGGVFVLRMEDIDGPRSRPEFARQILADLRWLGLDWDEGPDTGGPFSPYTQSERLERYAAALDRLDREGWLYPCFCSRAERLSVASAPHGLASEGPAYPGTCRGLTRRERRDKAVFRRPSLRFALPDRPVEFRDAAAGLQTFAPGAGGDFIVRRSDGIYGYQLAVAVDDAEMGITDVLRGRDLLDSTPRQILLLRALDLPVPQYAHIPLMHGPDGKRLSKRHGDISLTAIRASGTPPEKVVGVLAYASGLIERPEPVKPAELINSFRMEMIPSEPVVWDQPLQSLLAL